MRRREFLISSATALTVPLATQSHVFGGTPQTAATVAIETPTAASGPLHRHSQNSRYFANATGRAVLLQGSHMWNNLVDMGSDDPPAALDFAEYLSSSAAIITTSFVCGLGKTLCGTLVVRAMAVQGR